MRNNAKMAPVNSLYASLQYSEHNESFHLIFLELLVFLRKYGRFVILTVFQFALPGDRK